MTNAQYDTPISGDAVTWEAPDKGLWACETAHGSTVSTVPMRAIMERNFELGFRSSLEQLGLPLSHLAVRYVNGWPYVSSFLHDVPRSAGKPPPAFVLKALTRLHPGFRRRTKIAAAAIAEGRPQQFAVQWEQERASWIERNLELQRVATDQLDDHQLAEYLVRVTAAGGEGLQRHFSLVAGSIPLGAFLARCSQWGLSRDASRRAVMHSTPVHSEAAKRLHRVATALGSTPPVDFDQIRAHSAEAQEALDDYLDHHGWWATGDALDASRVIDHPAIVVGAIRARLDADQPQDQSAADTLADLRNQVPAPDREEFDRLARDAHRSHMMLDDNSGILGSWLAGIAGEGYRAAGRRLVERGRIRTADDVWAITTDDTVSLLRGSGSPTMDEVDASVAVWRAEGTLAPPPWLNGQPSPPPDPSVFPAPVAQLMTGIGAFLNDKFNEAEGVNGIGTKTVSGRAVVALNPSDAFDRLEPGDILVTSATTPAYNGVLTIVGGLVVTKGGPSCHAAIVARELGLTAIVGLANALTTIPDGAMITLDPVRALVSIDESV